jgi:hypothetical protein
MFSLYLLFSPLLHLVLLLIIMTIALCRLPNLLASVS